MSYRQRYRIDNGAYSIDLQFHDFRQLYDGRDPAPFDERALDESLVRYILLSAEEIPRHEKMKLTLFGPSTGGSDVQYQAFREAVHQYFSHEARKTKNEMSQLFHQGRAALFLGLVFLAMCSGLAFQIGTDASILRRAAAEGLIVLGWVALWRPLNIFLYEWWPFRRRQKVFEALAKIPIDVTHGTIPSPTGTM